jgi:hypothetical protein
MTDQPEKPPHVFQSGIRNLWLMPSLDVSDRNRNLSLKR